MQTATRSHRAAIAGLLLCLAPALALAELLARAIVDVPAFDDYDAIVDFLVRWVERDEPSARLRLLFEQHVEHRPAVLRAAAAAAFAVAGHLDLRWLQILGVLALPCLLAALFASFRPDAAARGRLLPFAPAALLLLHPQYWSAFLWPTCSVANFFCVVFALVCFRALGGTSWTSYAVAAAAGAAATFSQGNGVVALPLGLVALVGSRSRARRWAWLAFAAALAAVYAAVFAPPFGGWSAGGNLATPAGVASVALYVLNFLGSAAAFSQRGLSVAAGAALLASTALLFARGALRRSPALAALLLFLLASAGMNALVRAQQGAEIPLLQDRYRFFASAFLAASWLAWAAELAGRRRERAGLAGGLAASLAFAVASHAVHRGELLDFSRRLDEGLERWWTTGDSGLFYPRFVTASRALSRAYALGVLRPSPRLVAALGAVPATVALPEPGPEASFAFEALRRDPGALVAAGWARAGPTTADQEVFLVLRSARRTLVFPARRVPRLDPPALERMDRLDFSGFRLLADARFVPPGRYRAGVLVRRAGGAWLGFRNVALLVRGP
jgi:hypothetical protein